MSLVKRKIRRWSNEENILILEYLVDTLRNGKHIEKPSAPMYYQKLIESTAIQNCNENLIKNKVRNFQTSYIESLNWRKQTGQQIRESNGEGTYKSVLRKRYPYLHLMEEIWGHRNSTHSSYSSETEQFDTGDSEYMTENSFATPQLESAFFNEDNIKSEIDDVDVSSAAVSMSPRMLIDASTYNMNEVTTAKRHCKEVMHQSDMTWGGPENRYTNIQADQLALDKKRFEESLAFERDKFEFEKFKFTENLREQRQKWEGEIELKRRELEIRHLEIASNKEIKLKELELEILRRSNVKD